MLINIGTKMKKIETLKKNYEFRNVITKGKYFVRKQIIIHILPNQLTTNYIGIAINTKLCSAVLRNKIKRKIKENYRNIQECIKTGYHIVFLWNKRTEPRKVDFHEIEKEMKEIFVEANLFIEESKQG